MSIYKDQAIKDEEITLRPVYFNNGVPLPEDTHVLSYREYEQNVYRIIRNCHRDHAIRNRTGDEYNMDRDKGLSGCTWCKLASCDFDPVTIRCSILG